MRWIYLSPHLDDAVLSAGGLICEQTKTGIPVEIWTFMSGYSADIVEYSFLAQINHAGWGFSSAEETILARRAEDLEAAEILGAKPVHFEFLDCIYRRSGDGEWLYDFTPPEDITELPALSMKAITSPPQGEDAALPARIAAAITPRLLPDDVLVCQLSVGSHVDHVLVRQAAELLNRPLLYDIDIPYLFYKPEEVAPKSAGMKEKVHFVSESGLKSWQEAILAYKSQLTVLGNAFNTPRKAMDSIQSYWSELKGIRLFKPL